MAPLAAAGGAQAHGTAGSTSPEGPASGTLGGGAEPSARRAFLAFFRADFVAAAAAEPFLPPDSPSFSRSASSAACIAAWHNSQCSVMCLMCVLPGCQDRGRMSSRTSMQVEYASWGIRYRTNVARVSQPGTAHCRTQLALMFAGKQKAGLTWLASDAACSTARCAASASAALEPGGAYSETHLPRRSLAATCTTRMSIRSGAHR